MDFLEGASWDTFQRISGHSAVMFKHGVNLKTKHFRKIVYVFVIDRTHKNIRKFLYFSRREQSTEQKTTVC